MPAGHGVYHGLDLERLDPENETDLTILIEAHHPELDAALRRGEEVLVAGEPFSPRLHVAVHQVIASQLLADDPPEIWQTVQRLAGLGYDWHNVMHMISAAVGDDLFLAVTAYQPLDPADYAGRLDELPGDWPSPEDLGLR
jgi:hypothetical protein